MEAWEGVEGKGMEEEGVEENEKWKEVGEGELDNTNWNEKKVKK